MDPIETGRGCSRCGERVELRVVEPGDGVAEGDSLEALVQVGLDERIVLLCECGCSHPRMVGLQGAGVYYADQIL